MLNFELDIYSVHLVSAEVEIGYKLSVVSMFRVGFSISEFSGVCVGARMWACVWISLYLESLLYDVLGFLSQRSKDLSIHAIIPTKTRSCSIPNGNVDS